VERKPRTARSGWLIHCKPGDSFTLESSPEKIAQDVTNAIVDCRRRGVHVTSERVAIIHGSMANPSIIPAVVITVVSTGNIPQGESE
jgi:hypothetical protein